MCSVAYLSCSAFSFGLDGCRYISTDFARGDLLKEGLANSKGFCSRSSSSSDVRTIFTWATPSIELSIEPTCRFMVIRLSSPGHRYRGDPRLKKAVSCRFCKLLAENPSS